jgi:hypothetical protein
MASNGAGDGGYGNADERGGFTVREEAHWAIEHLRKNFAFVVERCKGLDASKVEQVYYKDLQGVPCKGRVDAITSDLLFDLKTVSDWSRRDQVMLSEHYGVQLVHYARVADFKGHLAIVWAESKPPYRVDMWQISLDHISRAEHAHDYALQTYTKSLSPAPKFKF